MARAAANALDARDFSTASSYLGSATAAKIPMIKTTTNSSISVNPAFFPAG